MRKFWGYLWLECWASLGATHGYAAHVLSPPQSHGKSEAIDGLEGRTGARYKEANALAAKFREIKSSLNPREQLEAMDAAQSALSVAVAYGLLCRVVQKRFEEALLLPRHPEQAGAGSAAF